LEAAFFISLVRLSKSRLDWKRVSVSLGSICIAFFCLGKKKPVSFGNVSALILGRYLTLIRAWTLARILAWTISRLLNRIPNRFHSRSLARILARIRSDTRSDTCSETRSGKSAFAEAYQT